LADLIKILDIIAVFASAYLAYLLIRSDRSNPSSVLMAASALFFGMWNFSDLFRGIVPGGPWRTVLDLTRWAALHLLPVSLLLFALCFPFPSSFIRKWRNGVLLCVPPAVIMALGLVSFLLHHELYFAIGFVVLHKLYSLVYLGAAVVVLVLDYRKVHNTISRTQVQLILAGMAASITGVIITELLPSIVLGRSPVGAPWGVFVLVLAGINVFRYQAVDRKGWFRDTLSLAILCTVAITIMLLIEEASRRHPGYSLYFNLILISWVLIVLLVSADAVSGISFAVARMVPALRDRRTRVKAAFIIYRDGRLMTQAVDGKFASEFADRDIFTSMLSAVESFVGEALGLAQRRSLKSLNYGEMSMLIEHGDAFSICVLYKGSPGNLGKRLASVARSFEETHGHAIEDWDGECLRFRDFGRVMASRLSIRP
jgi:hypothetical protein